ncbi:MAG: ribonuclease P protein component [Alistipes sp.]|nr:ribonuclease P protein component [Alistipes sp.]
MNTTLTKPERLHSYGAIRRLFKEGQSGFVYPFRYMFYIEDAAQSEAAILFSTPKKFHKRANKRNTIRRRMREVYRLNKEILTAHLGNRRIELALIYSSKTLHDYKFIENALKKSLEQIASNL